MRDLRSSSAMRPSICTRARSIMCSSSAELSAPEPVNANRCPHASGANRPRSCGPKTRNAIGHLYSQTLEPGPKQEGEEVDACCIDPLPVVSNCFSHLGRLTATFQRQNGNVFLPVWRCKFHHLLYNPLQVIEFRVYHLVRGLIGPLPGRQKPVELTQWVGSYQKRSHGPHWP